jgi:hypothetical protein
VLIVGGGCRGLGLCSELTAAGHAVRITTRTEAGRAAIESAGAECWVGTPDRLATLRGALENVTVVGWLLATASGTPEQVRALHSSRLEFFLGQVIDTTARGFVYELSGPRDSTAPGGAGAATSGGAGARRPGGAVPSAVLAEGGEIARQLTARNQIPLALIEADAAAPAAWLAAAHGAIDSILG